MPRSAAMNSLIEREDVIAMFQFIIYGLGNQTAQRNESFTVRFQDIDRKELPTYLVDRHIKE